MLGRWKIKVLNLYAGLGGNRALWPTNWDITALEYEPKIAVYYADAYPQDNVIIDDAHGYLLDHYAEFDFIWSSPPCQTHSSFRFNIGVRYRGVKPVYPEMTLWQEIIFLQSHFAGNWVVENVKPYYQPLIKPAISLQRHLFWSNNLIAPKNFIKDDLRAAQIPQLQAHHGIDLSAYAIPNKRQALRNCVEGNLGLYVAMQANLINSYPQGVKSCGQHAQETLDLSTIWLNT
jgi:DNA (cytosine-5)-methyltransferase 1